MQSPHYDGKKLALPAPWCVDPTAHMHLKLHPATVQALAGIPIYSDELARDVVSIVLATDGSGATSEQWQSNVAPAWCKRNR